MRDFRVDYELFSETLPPEHFPLNTNWLMLGPSGPRRLRLAVEHLAHFRGGICFCVDLDPRWVIKLIKKGWTDHLKAYQDHVIDQAMTLLSAGHEIRCLFTTPKLLEALCDRLEDQGTSLRESGITGIFSGGTEFTPQWYRFAVEELLDGVYMTPTYGNSLMGLAGSKAFDPAENYKITYYAPQPRAVTESGGLRRPGEGRGLWRNGPGPVDHPDPRVVHSSIPGAGRRGTGATVRAVRVGRRERRSAIPPLCRHHDGWCLLVPCRQESCKKWTKTFVGAPLMGALVGNRPGNQNPGGVR